jgi:dipeptidyl aminopeptidase/acylaminoacyl peptidase
MEKIITYEKLRNFAYVNDKIVKMPIKGIVLNFFGLGCQAMYWDDDKYAKFFAENGILWVVPYNNPWAWMNKQAVDYTDEIIDLLIEKYDLPNDIKIVSSGGSMGGYSALLYTMKAKRTPVACVADCPVCDMVYHFTERVDLPRTIYSAFYNENGTLDEILESNSPYHLAEKMPRVKYHVFHCDKDSCVNIDKHSRAFVERMEECGHSITFDIVNDKDHCQLTPEAEEKYLNYCKDAILK